MTKHKKPEAPYKVPDDQYQGVELRPYDGRPQCNDNFRYPSRVGIYRYYVDKTFSVESADE